VSGNLTSDGQPVSGAAVELQRRTRSGRQTIATVTTAADGTWSATLPLTRNAGIRALYRGAPGVSAVISPTVELAVPAQLTLQASAQQAVVGIPIVFSGTVSPDKERVILAIAQLQVDGSYREVRTVRVASDNGAFSRGIAFSAPGRYQVVARTEPDRANAAGSSQPVAITVG